MIKIVTIHQNKRHIMEGFCKDILEYNNVHSKITQEKFSVTLSVDSNVNAEEVSYAFDDYMNEKEGRVAIEGDFQDLGFDKNYSNLFPKFTAFSVLFFIFVYFLQGFLGKPFMDFMFYHKEIGLGFITEPWKFITPAFMHGSATHLIMNCMALYQIGTGLEKAYGPLKVLKVILVTALISNFMQFIITGPSFLGISGAIFGLVGYMWMKPRVDKYALIGMPNGMLVFGIISIIVGYIDAVFNIIPMVSFANEAHLFGLLSGIWLASYEMKKSKV